jgi:anti-sigma B factor antagonist
VPPPPQAEQPPPPPARRARERTTPRVDVAWRGAVVLIEVAGELQISGIDAVRAQLAELELADATGLVVDLTRCTFLDSSGIGLLFQLAARVQGRRRTLVVIAPAEHHRVLAVAGLENTCVLASDVDSALAVFDERAPLV